MSGRLDRMSDAQLGSALRSIGTRIEWPETPEVTGAVVREIRRREAHPVVPFPWTGGGRRWTRGLLIAAALLVAVAGTAIAATLVWNLGGITVEVVPPTSGPLPSATLGPEALGRRIALEDAPATVGFRPVYPASLGEPDEVYAGGVPETYVVLAWAPGEELPRIEGTPWGAILFEVPGENAFIWKQLLEGQASSALVDGDEAIWAQGKHPLELPVDGGHGRFLVTGNVLLWNELEFAMRFESLLGQEDAVRIAEETVIP